MKKMMKLTLLTCVVVTGNVSGLNAQQCPKGCLEQIQKQQTTSTSWETTDINDGNKGVRSFQLPFSPKLAIVSLIAHRNVGGTGVSSALKPQVTVQLVQNDDVSIPAENNWHVSLQGNKLLLDTSQGIYAKGYRGAFNIVLFP